MTDVFNINYSNIFGGEKATRPNRMLRAARKQESLALPDNYREIPEEEMYYEGGGISVAAVSAIIDVSLFAVTGLINIGLRAAGFFGKGAIRHLMLKSAPSWARMLHQGANLIGRTSAVGGILAQAGNIFTDVGRYIGQITSLFSIGGIVANLLDVADGAWNGQINL